MSSPARWDFRSAATMSTRGGGTPLPAAMPNRLSSRARTVSSVTRWPSPGSRRGSQSASSSPRGWSSPTRSPGRCCGTSSCDLSRNPISSAVRRRVRALSLGGTCWWPRLNGIGACLTVALLVCSASMQPVWLEVAEGTDVMPWRRSLYLLIGVVALYGAIELSVATIRLNRGSRAEARPAERAGTRTSSPDPVVTHDHFAGRLRPPDPLHGQL